MSRKRPFAENHAGLEGLLGKLYAGQAGLSRPFSTIGRYSMTLSTRIPDALEAKGWALYRAPDASFPHRDLVRLVSQGRSRQLELGVGYCILPLAQRDGNPDDVLRHLQYARRSRQLPTLHGDNAGQVAWIALRDRSLDVELAPTSDTYSFEQNDALTVIQHRLSNYNIHYFESIDELRNFVEPMRSKLRRDSEGRANPRWQLVQPDPKDGLFKLYPANQSQFLFRGQTNRYRPCLPTIVRGFPEETTVAQLDDYNRATLILNLTRTAWFNLNLRETPPMRWMSRKQVAFDETAVAQHYQLPTGYIDLSESLDVAAFFATCRYDPVTSSCEPVAEGEGVVYLIDRAVVGTHPCLKPISFQPFPRPSEQWGWVYETSLGEDFDALPHVRKMIFKQDGELSEAIADHFRRGHALFPSDPLSELALAINTAPVLPKSVLLQVANDVRSDPLGLPGVTGAEIARLIEKHKDVACDPRLNPLDVLDTNLRSVLDSNWKSRAGDFPPPFGIRLVRSR